MAPGREVCNIRGYSKFDFEVDLDMDLDVDFA
jgi:hypothetical protein